jgi:cell division protein FtsL
MLGDKQEKVLVITMFVVAVFLLFSIVRKFFF